MVCIIIAVVTVVCSATVGAAVKPVDNLILGVFPHLPPRELEKVYAPIAAELSKRLGHDVAFRSSSTYERFMKNLDDETYDIVFTQPFDYVKAADEHGYLPLATRDEPLTAMLVVQKGEPITEISKIKGMKISLPPEVSAVSRLFRFYLKKHGLDPDTDVSISYHRSHVSCMQQVIIGTVDACGTAAPALRFFNHKMGKNLKVILETDSIPHTLFAVHPRVPELDRQKILTEILSWSSSAKGKLILKRGKLKPFIKIRDSDYDGVRKLIDKDKK